MVFSSLESDQPLYHLFMCGSAEILLTVLKLLFELVDIDTDVFMFVIVLIYSISIFRKIEFLTNNTITNMDAKAEMKTILVNKPKSPIELPQMINKLVAEVDLRSKIFNTNTESINMPYGIVEQLITAITTEGYTVTGSSILKKTPRDIDVQVKGLKHNFVDVFRVLVSAFSRINFGGVKKTITVEPTNVLYGEKIDCRYFMTIVVTHETGNTNRIIIDLTDGVFDEPVYLNNTLSATLVEEPIFQKQPLGYGSGYKRGLDKFDFDKFSKSLYKSTYTNVMVPCIDNMYPLQTLETIVDLTRNDKAVINPNSVLFGNNVISIINSIRRIRDTNMLGKFAAGVDYKDTIVVIISSENKCELSWCTCNYGHLAKHQYGITKRTYITLQCCNTTVCADFFSNHIKATSEVHFCPCFHNGYHFLQFKKDCLLTDSDKKRMYRLTRRWDGWIAETRIIANREKKKKVEDDEYDNMPELESEEDDNPWQHSGPHGTFCECPLHECPIGRGGRGRGRGRCRGRGRGRGVFNYASIPDLESDFEQDTDSENEMPNLEDEETIKPSSTHSSPVRDSWSPVPNKKEIDTLNDEIWPKLPTVSQTKQKKIDDTKNMTPHCDKNCDECVFKMQTFQQWASKLVAPCDKIDRVVAMSLSRHIALNVA